jgi:hypothetical protein
MNKLEIIRVNISSTFMVRARCKNCGKGPDYYYSVGQPFKWVGVRSALVFSQAVKKWITRMVSNWYLPFSPRYFLKLGDFAFEIEDKSYDPLFHRTRGSNIGVRQRVVEFVGCSCGATVWAFNEKSAVKRPEITNRKGRYKYPQKFVF